MPVDAQREGKYPIEVPALVIHPLIRELLIELLAVRDNALHDVDDLCEVEH